MRHLIKTILLLSFLASCVSKGPDKVVSIDKHGEWRIDSVFGQKNNYKTEFVYIINNSFWRMGLDTCPIIIDSNLVFKNDSVFNQDKLVYTIKMIDSTSILLKSSAGKTYILNNLDKIYNFNTTEAEYKDKLKEYIKRDSLIRQVVGWWKLEKSTFKPIRLVNNPDRINDFTLHLDNNGEATFFVNDKVDSTETYGWTTNLNGLSFSKGCIAGSDSRIFSLDKYSMVMSMSMDFDTLYLTRCQPLTEK